MRRAVADDPLVGRNLVSSDGRASAILVYFLPMSDRVYQERGLDAAIEAIAEEERGGAEAWLTGGPHVRSETASILLRETLSLSLGILGALGLVLLLAYRTLRGVIVPLATISVAVVWTMGVVGLVGEPLNAVTALVPPLLTAIGLSYAVHVVTAYYEALRDPREGESNAEVVGRALAEVAPPVALTGVTTAAGLASLMLSPLAAVREFGLYTVLGVLFTLVVSLSFTPALLTVLGRPRRVPEEARDGAFERFVDRVALFDLRASHHGLQRLRDPVRALDPGRREPACGNAPDRQVPRRRPGAHRLREREPGLRWCEPALRGGRVGRAGHLEGAGQSR